VQLGLEWERVRRRIVPRRSATCASWRHSFGALKVSKVRRNAQTGATAMELSKKRNIG